MWILSCDGDLFDHKRRWLRPGSKHLLGRTNGNPQDGERLAYIEHKTVSRKHLLISVDDFSPAHALQLHKRTGITLTDNSKVGTVISGEKLVKAERRLDDGVPEYVIKLGSYESLFRLVWQPVVITCHHLPKKKGSEALAGVLEQLDGADVKLALDFVTNVTTHAVTKKRNNAVCLQALVQGRWVVTAEFIDALANAARRVDGANSSLEQDFDASWPKEEAFVVPPAAEPNPRGPEYMKPNPDRAEVFQHYTFVLLSQDQYEQLMPVITSGGGKALLWELDLGVSKVEDLVDYVRQLVGKKGSSSFRLSQYSEKGGPVLLRPGTKGGDEGARFLEEAERALDQAGFEQTGLLDAILSLDTAGLRRPLPETQTPAPEEHVERPRRMAAASPSPPRTGASIAEAQQEDNNDGQAQEAPAEQVPPVVKRRPRRFIPQAKVADFDDFDPSQFVAPASQSPAPPSAQPRPVQDMDVDAPSQPNQTQQNSTQSHSRKRSAPPDDTSLAQDTSAMLDSILTGQAALKKQKLEFERKRSGKIASTLSDPEPAKPAKKRPERQVDIMAEVAARRKREETQRRLDNETLTVDMDGVDPTTLAQIEVMELPVRQPPRQRNTQEGEHDARWDPAWNGRKNFKRFRPQGERRDAPRLQRVMVALQEVPRRGNGIGDEYWVAPAAAGAKWKSKSKSQSQSQSQVVRASVPSSDDVGDASRFRRTVRGKEEATQADEVVASAEEPGSAQSRISGTPSQTMGTESQRKTAGKRPAVEQGGAVAKRVKQTRLAAPPPVVIDDDDDGLKFRRRRK